MRCLASLDGRGWDEEEVGSERDLRAYTATLGRPRRQRAAGVSATSSPPALPERGDGGLRRWGYRSMVSLPLVAEGRPIGLIDVFDTRCATTPSILDFIRSVGRLLAGAFEKAMLVERLESGNRDLRVLVESGLEFGATLDVDAVLGTVAERILDVSRADLCDIYGLVDGEDVPRSSLSLGAESLQRRRWAAATRCDDFGTFAEATRDAAARRPAGRPQRPAVERARPRGRPRVGLHVDHDVPLVAGGELIGFLELYNASAARSRATRSIVGLAQVAGQAISNARLYRELDESVRWMTLMSESALELSSSLDLRDTLLATARRLCASVGVPECEITVIEGAGLRTLMRVDRGTRGRGVDRPVPAAARRGRHAGGHRDQAADRRRVAARPAPHGQGARDQPGLRDEELGDAAARSSRTA